MLKWGGGEGGMKKVFTMVNEIRFKKKKKKGYFNDVNIWYILAYV